jgi:hypothetical protein
LKACRHHPDTAPAGQAADIAAMMERSVMKKVLRHLQPLAYLAGVRDKAANRRRQRRERVLAGVSQGGFWGLRPGWTGAKMASEIAILGQTGLFTAYLAKRYLGLSGAEALQWVRRDVPRAVETTEQQRLVLHDDALEGAQS